MAVTSFITKMFAFVLILAIICQITLAQVPCIDDGTCIEVGFDCGDVYLDEVCIGGFCDCSPFPLK